MFANSRLPFLIPESKANKLLIMHFSFIANTYPSEILEGRLYLGDHLHAQDKTILQNLRITHVLNVSDNIPNYFEKDGK